MNEEKKFTHKQEMICVWLSQHDECNFITNGLQCAPEWGLGYRFFFHKMSAAININQIWPEKAAVFDVIYVAEVKLASRFTLTLKHPPIMGKNDIYNGESRDLLSLDVRQYSNTLA